MTSEKIEERLHGSLSKELRKKFPCKGEVYHMLYPYNPEFFKDEGSSLVFIALKPSTEWTSHTDILFADTLGRLKSRGRKYPF